MRSTATLNHSNLRFNSMPLQAVGAAQEARENAAEVYFDIFNRACHMFDFVKEAAAHDASISFDNIAADLHTMHRDIVEMIRSVDLDPEELRRFGLRFSVQEWDEYIPNSPLEAVYEVLNVLDHVVIDPRGDFNAISQHNNPAISQNPENRGEQGGGEQQYLADLHWNVFNIRANYDDYMASPEDAHDLYEVSEGPGTSDDEDNIGEEDVQEVLPNSFEFHRQAVLDAMAGASEEQIDSLGTVAATGNDKGHSCCICMTDFEEGEELRELACSDRFHKDCIDAWLRRNPNCPVDRSDAFPAS